MSPIFVCLATLFIGLGIPDEGYDIFRSPFLMLDANVLEGEAYGARTQDGQGAPGPKPRLRSEYWNTTFYYDYVPLCRGV
jgi:hypothetical protein